MPESWRWDEVKSIVPSCVPRGGESFELGTGHVLALAAVKCPLRLAINQSDSQETHCHFKMTIYQFHEKSGKIIWW